MEQTRKKQWIKGIDNKWVIISGVFIVLVALGAIGNALPKTTNYPSSSSPTSQTKPATFSVSQMSTEGSYIAANLDFTVSATISNSGDVAGTYNLELKQDGKIVKVDQLNIPAHTSQLWSIKMKSTTIGESTLSIGDALTKIRTLMVVYPADLRKELDANEIAFDNKYKDQMVFIIGKIDDIGKDILGDPYITLDDGSIFCTQCMFQKSDANKLATLSKGQAVAIRANYSGHFGNIIFRNSVLVAT